MNPLILSIEEGARKKAAQLICESAVRYLCDAMLYEKEGTDYALVSVGLRMAATALQIEAGKMDEATAGISVVDVKEIIKDE